MNVKIIRLISILLLGGLLTYLTYQSKYQTFFFEEIITAILVIIALLIFIWVIIGDIRTFKQYRKNQNFMLTFLCIFFVSIILALKIKISSNFNKESLLKVFYDGDYNGTGIDFKTDGTYIFDNSAIGVSSYFYGTYTIDKDKIILDKDIIDGIPNLKYLKISITHKINQTDKYLFQTNESGNIIEGTEAYRVIVDNRE